MIHYRPWLFRIAYMLKQRDFEWEGLDGVSVCVVLLLTVTCVRISHDIISTTCTAAVSINIYNSQAHTKNVLANYTLTYMYISM